MTHMASAAQTAASPEWWRQYEGANRVITQLVSPQRPAKPPATIQQLKTRAGELVLHLGFSAQAARLALREYDAQHIKNVYTQPVATDAKLGFGEGPWVHSVEFTGSHTFRKQLIDEERVADSALQFTLQLQTNSSPSQRKHFLTWLMESHGIGGPHVAFPPIDE